MKKNLGSTDKIVRLLTAAIIAVLYFTNTVSGPLGIVLIAIAAILALTSFVSFCPLYFALGLHSNKKIS